jgi:hypothetical protein
MYIQTNKRGGHMPTTEELALELALKNSQMIREVREQAIENAKKAGSDSSEYYFIDNIVQVIEDNAPYKLTLVKKDK